MNTRGLTRRWLPSLTALSGCLLIVNGAWAAPPPTFGAYAGQGYQEIAMFAATYGHNPSLAKYFADRSRAARVDEVVEPVLVSQWTLDPTTVREANNARQQLTSRLNNGARLTAPKPAAIAQVNFDCWMAQFPAVPGQPSSADCRRKFYGALAQLPVNPGPSGAPPAPATAPIPDDVAAAQRQCVTRNLPLDCQAEDVRLTTQLGTVPKSSGTPTDPGVPGTGSSGGDTAGGGTTGSGDGSGSGGGTGSGPPVVGVSVGSGDNTGNGSLVGISALSGNNSGNGGLVGISALSGNNSGNGGLVGASVGSGDNSGNGGLVGASVGSGDNSGNGGLVGASVGSGNNTGNGGLVGASVGSGNNTGNGGLVGASVGSGNNTGNGGLVGASVGSGNNTGNGGLASVSVGSGNTGGGTNVANVGGTVGGAVGGVVGGVTHTAHSLLH